MVALPQPLTTSSWNWPPIAAYFGTSAMCSAIASLISRSFGTSVSPRSAPPRGEGCAHRVQFLQGGAEVTQLHLVALQQEADHVGRAGLGWRVDDGATAVTAPDRHQALGFEDPQRLAQ